MTMSVVVRSAASLALSWAFGCSAHHVRLTTPDTDPGARYVCLGEGPCQPADVDVPSERNRSGTKSITLPRECAGKIHQILVIDADSSEPKVDVTCAPQEEPIDEMRPPEAKN